jgi:hypothetical protein
VIRSGYPKSGFLQHAGQRCHTGAANGYEVHGFYFLGNAIQRQVQRTSLYLPQTIFGRSSNSGAGLV